MLTHPFDKLIHIPTTERHTMTTTLKGEITNNCNCLTYIDENDNEVSIDDTYTCYGDCWEYSVEDFTNVTKELMDSNDTGWWKVSNLRLWNGEVSGYFHAEKVTDLLTGMTVRGDWTMRYEVFTDRIEYSLSHHDAMGSASVLTPISDEQREELGLY